MIGRGLRVRAGNRRFQVSGARVQSWGVGMGILVFWESVRSVEAWSGNFSSGKGIDWEVELGRGMVGGWP